MKNRHILRKALAFLLTVPLVVACEEEDFSADYDIQLPVSKIIDFNPKTEFVDKEITLYGENLDLVTSVSIGNVSCPVISREKGSMVIKVSRTTEAGNISVSNNYKRSFTTDLAFTPKYLDMSISKWPSEIERGLTISINGQNMDMIQSVKFESVTLSKAAVTITTATYATANLELPESGRLIITSKTGQVLTSGVIKVIAPKDTYIPKTSIMVFDFDETLPVVKDGNPTGPGAAYTAGYNLGSVSPFFGKHYSLIAARGNGWDGQFQVLESTNGGKGFDLTNFTNPYITFLVNTNGKQGYFNPAITIAGSESDKHFTGQGGEYKDNYKISTQGWEWRSYNLEAMGWSNIKSNVEKIAFWIRGGNVGNGNSEAFEVHIDQVMITDGPLNPNLMFDFETMPSFNGGSASQNGGSGVAAAGQGTKYLTVKDANTGSWSWKGNILKGGTNPAKYAPNKTFYVNFLVNTGNSSGGYFQLIFEQSGGTKLGHHFKGDNPYKDNYKFAPTNGKWEWRSYKIDPAGLENWGSVPELDLMKPFDFTVDFTSGNVSGNYETNVDYFIVTSVPLDTKIR